jgi:hypothetical protein
MRRDTPSLLRLRIAAGFFSVCALLGCSATFDSDADDVRISGQPFDPAALFSVSGFRLRDGTRSVRLQRGRDGALWMTAQRTTAPVELHLFRMEPPRTHLSFRAGSLAEWRERGLYTLVDIPKPPTTAGTLRFIPVGGEPQEEVLPAGFVLHKIRQGAPFLSNAPADPRQVLILRYREGERAERFSFPWPQDKKGMNLHIEGPAVGGEYLVYHGEDFRLRVRRLATGEETQLASYYYWGVAVDKLLYEGTDGLSIYDPRERQGYRLGLKIHWLDPSRELIASALHNVVIGCSDQGLRALDLRTPPSPSPMRLLDSRWCSGAQLITDDHVRYYSGRIAQELPLDEQFVEPPPLPADQVERARCRSGLRVHTQSAAVTPEPGIDRLGLDFRIDPTDGHDAWIGGWRFSERAYEVTLSADCRRVRWKERADRPGGRGELFSASISQGPGGRRLRLGRNVGFYRELQDGRVVVSDNLLVPGVQNRVLLIDEDRREARLLLDSVPWLRGAEQVPDGGGLLLEVHETERADVLVTYDESAIRLVHIPVPPRSEPWRGAPPPPLQHLE